MSQILREEQTRPTVSEICIKWRLRGKYFWKVNQSPCNDTKIGQVETRYPACNHAQKRTSWQTCKRPLDLEQSARAPSFAFCQRFILLPVGMLGAIPWYLLPGSAQQDWTWNLGVKLCRIGTTVVCYPDRRLFSVAMIVGLIKVVLRWPNEPCLLRLLDLVRYSMTFISN
ncbi:hypothetical protein PMIN01_00236 [Paraphaeosphaeria minitans]|uniref:Uncharacterized protein n=1 Tax=Paraphaeosphaeria minitans TaxID=565426 RepID=A0A9P6GRV4_9PLEO|nr:hypothetical protein PMIN01_00236 [Paraphaeosphaeria minitans]